MKRVCGLLALVMVLAALPLSSGPLSAQEPDFDITGGHFYTQANGQGGAGGTGYSITDDGGASTEWSMGPRSTTTSGTGADSSSNAIGYPLRTW